VTGIKANDSEDFQILKYEPGQFYRQHHDYIELQADRQCGSRVESLNCDPKEKDPRTDHEAKVSDGWLCY
jgi:Rps23 Pro-64 3,4-dihydroxylase Tpa1-like proline 4-hydroxylase